MIHNHVDMKEWTQKKISLWEQYLNDNPNSKIANRVRRGISMLKDLL